jgi:serine/threonine protein kinase
LLECLAESGALAATCAWCVTDRHRDTVCAGAGAGPDTLRIVGTPGYLAPEVTDLGHVGPERDVFAMGVVMLQVPYMVPLAIVVVW